MEFFDGLIMVFMILFIILSITYMWMLPSSAYVNKHSNRLF